MCIRSILIRLNVCEHLRECGDLLLNGRHLGDHLAVLLGDVDPGVGGVVLAKLRHHLVIQLLQGLHLLLHHRHFTIKMTPLVSEYLGLGVLVSVGVLTDCVDEGTPMVSCSGERIRHLIIFIMITGTIVVIMTSGQIELTLVLNSRMLTTSENIVMNLYEVL